MQEKIRKIGTTEIYDGIRVHLVKEKLALPNGNETEWELIKHPGAAAVIPVDDDGNILMVRQYRLASDNTTLEIPAGCLDSPDEDPFECAKRELEEETGYDSDDIRFLFKFYSSIGICDEVIHVYVAKNLKETAQNLDEDEFVSVERHSLEGLLEMVFEGEIMDNKTISSLLAYSHLKERDKI